MAYFYADVARINEAAAQMAHVMQNMNTIRQQVNSAASGLRGSSSMINSARRKARSASDNILNEIHRLNTFRVKLMQIATCYKETESKAVSNATGAISEIEANRGNDDPEIDFRDIIFPPFLPGVLPWIIPFFPNVLPWKIIDYILNWNEYKGDYSPQVKLFSKIDGFTKLLDKVTGCDALGGISSGASVISNLYKMASSDLGSKDFFSALLDVGSGASGVAETAFKFLKDIKNEAISGIVGNILGVGSEAVDLYGMSLTEAMKNANGLIDNSVGFVDDLLKGGAGLKGLEAVGHEAKLGAITSAISMVLYAGGDVYERASDGSFTMDDAGQVGLGTGIVGATTLINGATFGLVDIDSTEATNIFNDNIDYMTEAIQNTGAPTWAQLLMVAPGAVTVTAWSACEVVGDWVSDTYNSFMSLFD